MSDWARTGLVAVNPHPNYSLDPADDMRRGLEALARGVLPMQRLVTHRFPLSGVGEAFDLAISQAPGYFKAVVTPDGHA
jgi:threonine dehydrogenase-like Zn-dependent dehydrogenase